MKTISSIVLAVVLTLRFAMPNNCDGQVVAIGHVTAEVIESISASSLAVTDLSLGTNAAGVPAAVNLGAVTINSGSNVTCNVVVKSASLTDGQGNGFTLNPALAGNETASVAPTNGSQTLQLSGTANLDSNQSSGLYQGSYTVVFAYN